MSTNKLRVSQNLMIVCVVIIAALVAGVMSPSRNLSAAPTGTVTLTAVQDTFIDINEPATNFDHSPLNAANSSGAFDGPDVTTKRIFLEFDLSGVAFEIKSAAFSLATLTCGGLVPVDRVKIAVYGVDNAPANDWSETSLTWDTQPVVSGSALILLGSGKIEANISRRYTWTDSEQGVLSSWLETQRTANDSSATLVLVIDKSNQPGLAGVFFENSEETGAAYGCPDSSGAPALWLSSRVGQLIFLPVVLRSG